MKEYSVDIKMKVTSNLIGQDFKKRGENKKCYFKDCNCLPIDSHSIQESLLRKTIGNTGSVYNQTIQSVSRNIHQGKIEVFNKLPITQAGVFPGFCGDSKKGKNSSSHDTNLFKKVEIQSEVEKSSCEEYVFLYAYRSLVYQLYIESVISSSEHDRSLKSIDNNPVVSGEKISQILDITSSLFPLNSSLEKMKSFFEKYIADNGEIIGCIADDFTISCIPIEDSNLEFADIGRVNFDSSYPILVGLIPNQFDKPNLFFVVTHREDAQIHNVIKCCIDINFENAITNLVTLTGNLMLSENLYNNLSLSKDKELGRLEEFISKDTYNQYDIIKPNGFSLFRT